MRIGLCYETVVPARGGCEHYISDLARRLADDGHEPHLFACRWDASALPAKTVYHSIPAPGGPRFVRPWRFARACLAELQRNPVDVSMGFDKTWGQDILYPQGGLHSASRAHSLLKQPPGLSRLAARILRWFDLTTYSFARLERRQYLGPELPIVLVNSQMVKRHFREFLGLDHDRIRVLYSAIDPGRFVATDRDARRTNVRAEWGVGTVPTALFVAMNYRLKGLAPLIRAVARIPADRPFRLVVVGGAKTGRYEALARSLGAADRIRFLGFRADPRDCFFGADFLVHPTFYDPCSLVALEALSCGLPVVTSRYNGASELLSPPTDGLVVADPHDADELSRAIITMAEKVGSGEPRRAAEAAGRRWTFDDHYRDLTAVFHEVANRSPVT